MFVITKNIMKNPVLCFLFMVKYVVLFHSYALDVKLSIDVNHCFCTMRLVLQVAVFNHSKHSGMNLNKIVT